MVEAIKVTVKNHILFLNAIIEVMEAVETYTGLKMEEFGPSGFNECDAKLKSINTQLRQINIDITKDITAGMVPSTRMNDILFAYFTDVIVGIFDSDGIPTEYPNFQKIATHLSHNRTTEAVKSIAKIEAQLSVYETEYRNIPKRLGVFYHTQCLV